MTYFGEFCYLNSSCIKKVLFSLMFISSSRNKFELLYQNSITDVFIGFCPPHVGAHPGGHQHGVSIYTNLYRNDVKIILLFLQTVYCDQSKKYDKTKLVRFPKLNHDFLSCYRGQGEISLRVDSTDRSSGDRPALLLFYSPCKQMVKASFSFPANGSSQRAMKGFLTCYHI